MTYLEEFRIQIQTRNFSKFLQLWEEYCLNDQVDVEELILSLELIKNSDFAKSFGKLVETALPLWKLVQNKEDSYKVLRLLIDLENTNTPALAEIALQALKEKYGQDPQFNERLRLVGLRTRENFQGALTHFDLLTHMEKGKFVYHAGGWGTGEIVDLSPIRQQVTIEFENVPGKKHVTFDTAFKSLVPLRDEHFLVRRFAFADDLEKDAKDDSVAVIKMLLNDLGPKSASEIKDLMSGFVIPEEEWTKWWQNTRAKLKKDPLIESPEALRDPFKLRKSEITHEERLHKAIHHKTNIDEIIETAYNFLRDLPSTRQNQSVKESVKEKLLGHLSDEGLSPEQELQILLTLEAFFDHAVPGKEIKNMITDLSNIEEVINNIEIIALKKRALTLVKEHREDWVQLYLNLMLAIKHSTIRDYIIKELNQEAHTELVNLLKKLLQHPEKQPEFFIWYFQKIISDDKDNLPFSDKEGQFRTFESFLVLLSSLEHKTEYKELVKKMYTVLSGKRYAVVRSIIEGASLEDVKEFLLLASKCHTFTDHDKKTLRSLAAVVHPSIGKGFEDETTHHIIWATEDGYARIRDQVKHLGTVEVVDNAKEIEAARSLGDLRENSEYKFALERRSRIQSQIRTLSEQLNRARIITKNDIHPDEVGIGSIVEVEDPKGNHITYTILGPWEADAENNILSFQSKLAQAMIGSRKGEQFDFRNEQYKVIGLKSYL